MKDKLAAKFTRKQHEELPEVDGELQNIERQLKKLREQIDELAKGSKEGGEEERMKALNGRLEILAQTRTELELTRAGAADSAIKLRSFLG